MTQPKQGTVNFNPSAGNFIGTIDVGNTLPSGSYTVKINASQYLRSLVPGIQKVNSGQLNQLPETTFVTGDVTGDNQLNQFDYNLFLREINNRGGN